MFFRNVWFSVLLCVPIFSTEFKHKRRVRGVRGVRVLGLSMDFGGVFLGSQGLPLVFGGQSLAFSWLSLVFGVSISQRALEM